MAILFKGTADKGNVKLKEVNTPRRILTNKIPFYAHFEDVFLMEIHKTFILDGSFSFVSFHNTL